MLPDTGRYLWCPMPTLDLTPSAWADLRTGLLTTLVLVALLVLRHVIIEALGGPRRRP